MSSCAACRSTKTRPRSLWSACPTSPALLRASSKRIGDANVNVDMIVQNISHGGGTPATDLSFTVDKADLLKARRSSMDCKQEIGYRRSDLDEKIGKLSIVGVGMRSHTGVAGKMFETLARRRLTLR